MATIGLDIGHGRNTFPPSKGVYKNGVGYHEYDANSRVGLALKKLLEDAGHTVVMAQPFNSNDVPLIARTNLYFSKKVDIIISLHANASGNKSANGYAAFYWHTDTKAKKLADLYEDEIKKQGFALWGGSRPSKPNDWSNFHMCRVPAQRGVPSILLENGFMTSDHDFEWIFGSKKNEYAERCAIASFNTIQRYLGEPVGKVSKPTTQVKSETVSKPKPSKPKWTKVAGNWSGQTLYDGQYGEPVKQLQVKLRDKGYLKSNQVDSYYGDVTKNAVKQAQKDAKIHVDGLAGKQTYNVLNKKNTPKPKGKSISQMADEVIAGKHGSGHDARRKSLGISQSEYEKVRAEVNRRAGATVSKPTPKPKKSISQMATEVIRGDHGQGHEARRKSLGITKAEYEKVRAEVNRRL